MSNSLKVFAAIFVLLAAVAIVVGEKKTSDPEALALTFAEYDELIQAPVSSLTPLELAEYLIKQEHHYNLIDLQGSASSYQIPTAETHTIESFLARKIPVNETIILYSKNETEALQLYYLLLIRGYFKVKILQGGTAQWFSVVLQPKKSAIAEGDIGKRRKITEFFGGVLVGDSENEIATFNAPAIQLQKKHKVHRGC